MDKEHIALLRKVGVNPDGTVFDYLLYPCGVRAAVMVSIFNGTAWLVKEFNHVWFVPSGLSDTDYAWNLPSEEGIFETVGEVRSKGQDITDELVSSTRQIYNLPI